VQRTRIKICGICDPDLALTAAAAGADAIGLVFVPTSPRAINKTQARRIVRALPPFVEPVGLFVGTPPDKILQTAQEVGLKTVQLHGNEGPDEIAQLAPLRVIKALAFDPPNMAATIQPWIASIDHLSGLLLDSPPIEADQTSPNGGSGRSFDWQQLADFQRSNASTDFCPFVLAGGLTPDNVEQAISIVHPWAVDVSSGVESSRGVKDHVLIRDFCRSVQRADQEVI